MPSAAQYQEARARVAKAKHEAQEMVKQVFNDEAQALLEEMGIKSFGWTQYTPYFNDGDACVFSAHVDYPYINDYDEDGESLSGEEDESAALPGRPDYSLANTDRAEYDRQYRAYREPYEKVANFLRGYEEEDLEFMFGDHCIVTVARDGIHVEEYSHD